MAEEEENLTPLDLLPPPPPPKTLTTHLKDPSPATTSTPPPQFDPSRMIGIIKRKALIKDLAAAYHTECLAYCRELLELQKRKNEPFLNTTATEDLRKEALRSSSKRAKKKR
ncbi:hypothetical protein AALP_AA7G006400 [Arabis alpina]|uniref:Uncharacterized protein n=1 Tax=Arabis alpina TaxID=50452 RepID=A0A087GF61_ARAAL|nr:hypothetical protein AALP_AA7G006400 [Arabis alpina]